MCNHLPLSHSVSLFVVQVKSSSPEAARVLALLCLGEVGRSGSLGGSKEVQGVILEAIASTNEEVSFPRLTFPELMRLFKVIYNQVAPLFLFSELPNIISVFSKKKNTYCKLSVYNL